MLNLMEKYTLILDEKYCCQNWAVLKVDGKKDIINSKSGDDLLEFVNKELFPYLKGFKSITGNPKSIKYKIGDIFEFLDNRIANSYTLREILDIKDEMDFYN